MNDLRKALEKELQRLDIAALNAEQDGVGYVPMLSRERIRDLLAAHPEDSCDEVLYAPDAHIPCALRKGHKPVQKALHHITEDGEQFARRD